MEKRRREISVIDFHTHNFPDKLVKRALEVMCSKLEACCTNESRLLRPVGDGTVATQVADMERNGVDICVNCPVCTYPDNFEAIFRRALAQREADAWHFVQLASVHPLDPEYRRRIELLAENHIPGIKLHPNYQDVRLDDPALVPFFETLRDHGLFVLSHCGYDPGYVDAPMGAGPKQVAALLRRVPGLKFVAGHLGGECGNPPHAVDELLEFENCWIDTAVQFGDDDSEEAQRVVREWPADRMVFGTDYFWRDQRKLGEWVRALRPDPAEQELIFHKNAERILELEKIGVELYERV